MRKCQQMVSWKTGRFNFERIRFWVGILLVTVAIAYRHSSVSLLVSALEGAGFKVFCPYITTLTVQPHLTLAFGGMPIQVLLSQREEAVKFLIALQLGDVRVLDVEHYPPSREEGVSAVHEEFNQDAGAKLWKKLVNAISCFFFGVSAPWKEPALPSIPRDKKSDSLKDIG